jgi:hypothetical protein
MTVSTSRTRSSRIGRPAAVVASDPLLIAKTLKAVVASDGAY